MKRSLLPALALALILPGAAAQLPIQFFRTITHTYPGTYGTIGCTFQASTGLFHVAYFPTGTVYSFNIAGLLVNSFPTGTFPVPAPSPNGMAWNPADGLLYLVDNNGPVVVACTSQGTYVHGWSFTTPSTNPVGIAYNSDRGTIIISSNGILSEWTSLGTRIPAGTVNYTTSILSGVAYVPQTGHYLVSISGGTDLHEIDKSGTLISTTPLGTHGVSNIQDVDYDPISGFLTVVCNTTMNLFVFQYRPDGVATFGKVCAGSGGHLPARSWSGALATGQQFSVQVDQILGGSAALHLLGTSRASFGPLALPFDLGALGAPGCVLSVGPIFSSGYATGLPGVGTGKATARFTLPAGPALIGAVLYDQWLIVDQGANALGLIGAAAGQLAITR